MTLQLVTQRTSYRGLLFCVIPIVLSGCSSSGNSLGLLSERSDLIDAARAVRATTPAPLPRELDKHPTEAYVVEPGDGLLVLPAELDSPVRLPSDQTVMLDGTIDLGKYGRPVVSGKTVEEIEKIVNASVAGKSKEASFVSVRLINRVTKRYYVLGEVHTPGAFTLQGSETVLDGIMAAGGLNTAASQKEIILVRPSHPEGCRTVLAICYPEIVQLGDTSTNYQLRPGDRIYVATKCFLEGLHKAPCVTCTGPHHACQFAGN